jgi:hypothetical protein
LTVRRRHVYPVGAALVAGQVLRDQALGSESTYRVLDATDSIVDLEVIAAPGLKPGARIQVCVTAARAMEAIPASAVAPQAA